MKILCPFCGYELAKDASFCPRCFRSLIEKHQIKVLKVKRSKKRLILFALLLTFVPFLLLFPSNTSKNDDKEMMLQILYGQNLELPPVYQLPQEPSEEIEPPSTKPVEEQQTEIEKGTSEEASVFSQSTETIPQQVISSKESSSLPLTLSYKERPETEEAYSASKRVTYYNSDGSLSFRLSNKLQSDDVVIYDVQVKYIQNIYQISVDCDMPSGMEISCFNPSDGDVFMLKGGNTSRGRKNYVFKVDAKDVEQVDSITILFSYADDNRFGIFIDTYQF